MHYSVRHKRKTMSLQGFIAYLQTTPLLHKPVKVNDFFIHIRLFKFISRLKVSDSAVLSIENVRTLYITFKLI
jgi:hypothetical protein